MKTVTLYHGTTLENGKSILNDGVINGPVYMSPSIKTAEDYAANNSSDYMIFELEIAFDELEYDAEFINGDTDDLVQESLDAGSVFVDGDVSIENAQVKTFIDYEEV